MSGSPLVCGLPASECVGSVGSLRLPVVVARVAPGPQRRRHWQVEAGGIDDPLRGRESRFPSRVYIRSTLSPFRFLFYFLPRRALKRPTASPGVPFCYSRTAAITPYTHRFAWVLVVGQTPVRIVKGTSKSYCSFPFQMHESAMEFLSSSRVALYLFPPAS